MWFFADNGGPIYSAGNNYPLRGGKYSDFEGGIRVSAFVSGGLIPAAKRGLRSEGIGSVAERRSIFFSGACRRRTPRTRADPKGA